jgi:hypothetical protein
MHVKEFLIKKVFLSAITERNWRVAKKMLAVWMAETRVTVFFCGLRMAEMNTKV